MGSKKTKDAEVSKNFQILSINLDDGMEEFNDK
jgi:hypothetical protein